VPTPPLVLPDGSPLPLPYRWLHALRITSLTPWHFIEDRAAAAAVRAELLREVAPPNEATVRDWMPFARHQAQDDVAGFVLRDGAPTGEVYVVHLTWSGGPERPGWPGMSRYVDLWDWLARCALPETRAWAEDNEDEIADMLADPDER
jgi:hypothetical protein